MNDHPLASIYALLAAVTGAIAAAIATRVRLLPEVIDISIIPTGAGVASLTLTFYGALRRFPPERIGRLALAGNLIGGGATAAGLLIVLAVDVLS